MEATARDRLTRPGRRHVLTRLGALAAAGATGPVWAQAEATSAKLMQGGFVIGRTKPRAPIGVDCLSPNEKTIVVNQLLSMQQ